VLKPVSGFVAPKSGAVLTFKNLCFRDNLVYGYNGETGYVGRMPLGINCTVPADKLLAVIDRMPEGAVQISLHGGEMRIKFGDSRASSTAKLLTSTTESFPDFVPKDFVDICYATNVLQCLRVCLDAIDLNARNVFPGVAIRGEHVYSTDGLRYTRMKLNAAMVGEIAYIPAKSVKLLMRLGHPKKFIAWQGFVGGLYEDPPGLWLTCQLSGRFPNKMIDEQIDRPVFQLIELPEGLEESLGRIEVLSDAGQGAEMTSREGQLILSSAEKGAGGHQEVLPWPNAGAFKVRFNPRHFQDALKISRKIDLGSVCCDDPRAMRFVGDGVEHVMAWVEE